MKEIYVDIEGYEGLYQISDFGNVLSLHYHRSDTPKLLTPRAAKRRNGVSYLYVVLSRGNKTETLYIHRLVAKHFLKQEEGKIYVNHKDGNKHNNVVTNLEWVTPLENNLHSYRILHKHPCAGFRFDKNKNSKEVEQYYTNELGYTYKIATYANSAAAEMITKINQRCITAVCSGKAKSAGGYVWKYKQLLKLSNYDSRTF